MKQLLVLIEALQKGKELANKETWKNAAALTSIFSTIFSLILVFYPELQNIVSPASKATVINGLVEMALISNAIFGTQSAYTHMATSTTVGIGGQK